jgi:hypothetical protein
VKLIEEINKRVTIEKNTMLVPDIKTLNSNILLTSFGKKIISNEFFGLKKYYIMIEINIAGNSCADIRSALHYSRAHCEHAAGRGVN